MNESNLVVAIAILTAIHSIVSLFRNVVLTRLGYILVIVTITMLTLRTNSTIVLGEMFFSYCTLLYNLLWALHGDKMSEGIIWPSIRNWLEWFDQ